MWGCAIASALAIFFGFWVREAYGTIAGVASYFAVVVFYLSCIFLITEEKEEDD